MFGLTIEEFSLYRDLAQDYAVNQVAPTIINTSEILTPMNKDAKKGPNMEFVTQLVGDIETIITLATIHSAYDYAHYQGENELDEAEVIKRIHVDYETYLINQFISYGVTFDIVAISRILGEIILELPYMYSAVIEDESFDPDGFLEEKMMAYEDYLEENFPDYLPDDLDEEDEDEEE